MAEPTAEPLAEKERQLFERFKQQEHLVTKEPSVAAALSPDPQRLGEGARAAQARYGEGPTLSFAPEQRAALSSRRFPELHGVLSLFCEPLAGQKEILEEVGAAIETISRLLRLDMALGRMAWAADLIDKGGESGELLTAAAMRGACQGLLAEAAEAEQSTRYSAAQHLAITAAFTEPRRIDADERERQAEDQKTADRSAAPLLSQLSEAQQRAEMARVIEAFLQQIAQPRRDP